MNAAKQEAIFRLETDWDTKLNVFIYVTRDLQLLINASGPDVGFTCEGK